MNKEQIQEIILQVLSEQTNTLSECSLEFPVEVSAKHVHLTEEAIEELFGVGSKLTPKRELSQPGQYLCEERVSVVTAKGRLENVAVLGPARSAVQVELSRTDSHALGICAPLRMSGDLAGAADVYLVGPKGMIRAKGSAIVAKAHIHMTPEDAKAAHVTDGQTVEVTLQGERMITLHDVVCRVSASSALAMHIDFDEANACILPKQAVANMKAEKKTVKAESGCIQTCNPAAKGDVPCFEGKLITEQTARELAGKGSVLNLKKGVVITPSARDVFLHAKVQLVWLGGKES